MDNQLWVDRYKPSGLEGLIGQNKAIKETRDWLNSWKKGTALMFHGPPGCGKSLAGELLARERGYMLVELNASDKRSVQKLKEFSENLVVRPLFHRGKLIVIDEIDGISSRERGAAGELAKIIKNSHFPVILITNDPWLPKLRSLRNYCTLVTFAKVRSPSIEKRLKEICKQEGVSFDDKVIKNLARWSQGDLRSAISDLQTIAEGRDEIKDKDLETLGYRERENSIFNSLYSIFHSRSINVSRKAMWESDKDSDEILWWIETNMSKEFSGQELAEAYDILAKADVFRGKVIKQQNWRFKGFMTDMLSGISLFRKEGHGFSRYAPPDRLIRLGRSKAKRAQLNDICFYLGNQLHASQRVVKRDYIPYLRLILKKKKNFADGFLEKEDIDFIRKLK